MRTINLLDTERYYVTIVLANVFSYLQGEKNAVLTQQSDFSDKWLVFIRVCSLFPPCRDVMQFRRIDYGGNSPVKVNMRCSTLFYNIQKISKRRFEGVFYCTSMTDDSWWYMVRKLNVINHLLKWHFPADLFFSEYIIYLIIQ